MGVKRGEIWWTELSEPRGSEPGYRRPVVVIQSDDFNKSRIATVIAVVLTTNTRLAQAPGNVYLSCKKTGLANDSVANVSQVITIDKSFLTEKVGKLQPHIIKRIEEGLRLALAL
jgi:mRNA interferase MazF